MKKVKWYPPASSRSPYLASPLLSADFLSLMVERPYGTSSSNKKGGPVKCLLFR